MIINKFCIPDIQSYNSKLENIIMTTTITTAETSSLKMMDHTRQQQLSTNLQFIFTQKEGFCVRSKREGNG